MLEDEGPKLRREPNQRDIKEAVHAQVGDEISLTLVPSHIVEKARAFRVT